MHRTLYIAPAVEQFQSRVLQCAYLFAKFIKLADVACAQWPTDVINAASAVIYSR